ncbi:MAG: diaminopimelate epimerase [Nitrospirae bacterium]|nr:diaminopimelate epimerase [Nitrospirota bacterium]
MKLRFTKMHGLGNDFIVIDRVTEKYDAVLGAGTEALRALAGRLCHRRFGIGADQLLLLESSGNADFAMRIFNADGSEVEMCGNGIRCVAAYIWKHQLSDKTMLSIDTKAGIIRPEKAGDMVRVDMGEPVLEGRMIPVNIDGPVKDHRMTALDREFCLTCVSMGNPHAVIVVDDVEGFDVCKYGPVIENDPLFPKRTNVEFIQAVSGSAIKMRVWERGSGETMACGTGASAAAVASHIRGLTGRKTVVTLPGGDLTIEWAGNNHVYMTGPAVSVFEGSIEV